MRFALLAWIWAGPESIPRYGHSPRRLLGGPNTALKTTFLIVFTDGGPGNAGPAHDEQASGRLFAGHSHIIRIVIRMDKLFFRNGVKSRDSSGRPGQTAQGDPTGSQSHFCR